MTSASTIASVGPALPHDLFAATGRYAGPLGWTLDREMPFAARWMETKFAPWAASILEDWAAGAYNHHDAVVFARAEDNAQRLYYYICELRRRGVLTGGPEPLVFDSAQGPRETSVTRTAQVTRKLAARLGVSDDALADGIAATNAARRTTPAARPAAPVCLVLGTPPPDHGLHDAIAAQGWHAEGPTLADVWRDAGAEVEEGTADPCTAIARQIARSPLGNRAFTDRAATLRNRIATLAPRSAVLWYSEDEEAQVWDIPALRRVLAEAAVPALVLTRRSWGADPDAAAQIAAFLQEIGA